MLVIPGIILLGFLGTEPPSRMSEHPRHRLRVPELERCDPGHVRRCDVFFWRRPRRFRPAPRVATMPASSPHAGDFYFYFTEFPVRFLAFYAVLRDETSLGFFYLILLQRIF